MGMGVTFKGYFGEGLGDWMGKMWGGRVGALIVVD